eukprot:TRINITY_DN74353_c0_g1_i1.p1 TRINITY_DN74353_c0_g1~~TRINITY_DN74353_c0_g1_i1.p1  ORF type:complete len:411 (+),score=20.56 TRINITY_DN74353_c0_g1_i1:55-1287(+)
MPGYRALTLPLVLLGFFFRYQSNILDTHLLESFLGRSNSGDNDMIEDIVSTVTTDNVSGDPDPSLSNQVISYTGVVLDNDVAPPPPVPCNHSNKQRAVYTQFEFAPPIAQRNLFDVSVDVLWGDLTSLREHKQNGVFTSFTLHFGGGGTGIPGGYVGAQLKGEDLGQQFLLFSLWDNDGMTVPINNDIAESKNCERHCNDGMHCHKNPDGTTGSRCVASILMPTAWPSAYNRLRIQRTEAERSVFSTTWKKQVKGSVWQASYGPVDGPSVVIGSILIVDLLGDAESGSGGISNFQSFHEQLGCVPCGAYELKVTKRLPEVEDTKSKVVRAHSAFKASNPAGTCARQAVGSDNPDSRESWVETGREYSCHQGSPFEIPGCLAAGLEWGDTTLFDKHQSELGYQSTNVVFLQ